MTNVMPKQCSQRIITRLQLQSLIIAGTENTRFCVLSFTLKAFHTSYIHQKQFSYPQKQIHENYNTGFRTGKLTDRLGNHVAVHHHIGEATELLRGINKFTYFPHFHLPFYPSIHAHIIIITRFIVVPYHM